MSSSTSLRASWQGARRSRRFRGSWGLLACATMAGCGEFARWVAPGAEGDAVPAQVAMAARVFATTSAAATVSLDITTQYLKRDAGRALLGELRLPMGATAAQAVRVPVDLAACLGDRERAGAEERACTVVFTLALFVDQVEVDRREIGPLRLTPGGTTQVAEAVSLHEIAGIELQRATGAPVRAGEVVSLVNGTTLALLSRIVDVRGAEVSGRAVDWSSDAPQVATVSSSGGISALALGTATLTARVSGITRTVPLRVVRRPAVLAIDGGMGSGSGVVRSTPPGIDCRVAPGGASGDCSFEFAGEAEVSLSLVPDAGSVAEGWGAACASAVGDGDCRLTMEAPRSVLTRFTALRRVQLRAVGDGRGRVTGDAGIDCRFDGATRTGRCDAEVIEGRSLVLRAVPEAGDGAGGVAQVFGGWGGACASATDDGCALRTGAAALEATVRFLGGRALAVALEGTGDGAVVLGSDVLCARASGAAAGRCSEVAPHGTRVTLTARAAARGAFLGWGGDCAGTTASECSLVLSEGRRVTAAFAPLRRLTVVADSGDGAGQVTGGAGLDCRVTAGKTSGRCTVDVVDGATVELSAVPEGGAASRGAFAGWGGECSAASTGSCRLLVTLRDREVRVRFVGEPRLRVELTGSGGGQVTSAVGIDCLLTGGSTVGTCEEVAARGSTVTLTARPDAYSVFVGWTGACAAVTGPVCTVSLSEARTVRATFAVRRVTLTVQLLGPVAGSVQVNSGRVCSLAAGQGSTICTIPYNAGTVLQLVAVAGTGSRFVGFGSTCNGTAPCLLTIAHDRVVTATFDQVAPPPPPPPPPTVAFSFVMRGGGSASVVLNGAAVCSRSGGIVSGPCLGRVPIGSIVTVSVSVGTGSRFEGWEGACTGTVGFTCTVTAVRDETFSIATGVAR